MISSQQIPDKNSESHEEFPKNLSFGADVKL